MDMPAVRQPNSRSICASDAWKFHINKYVSGAKTATFKIKLFSKACMNNLLLDRLIPRDLFVSSIENLAIVSSEIPIPNPLPLPSQVSASWQGQRSS